MSINKRLFGKTEDGNPVHIYTLSNDGGMKVEITNFGGIIVSINVPDRNGKIDDVTLGFESLDGYLKKGPFFGAVIGRHANRIEGSEFEINGVKYSVAANEGRNHLHGGVKGFDKALWKAEIISGRDADSLKLTYLSIDGEENYPGNLEVTVIYTLTGENELIIDYYAISDKDTVVNLTNHAYFNLKGHASGVVLGHELYINADSFTVINDECLPTGGIRSVTGSVMDFTRLVPIGPGLTSDDQQIALGNGYDHNWVLNVSGNNPEKAAELYEPESGRIMEVYTTKPGVQFYSGNSLDGIEGGKDGKVYQKWDGLCLETQYFPNALKHKHFPSPILKAGEEYKHTTIYKFSVK